MTEVQPLYVSIEGLGDSSSQSEDEDDSQPEHKKVKRHTRKSGGGSNGGKYYDDPDYGLDSAGEGDGAPAIEANHQQKSDDKIVALSKKQLNRLAAMEIYPIPSGGIGTVNASLFNPVTIKWLMKNFETVEGSSLPRYLVYNHYLLHCKSLNIKPINAASFGKVIRSVFLGLQTRRLGTRGNSKYHYCGMRIKPDSPLLHVLISDVEPRKQKANSAGRNGANGGSANGGNASHNNNAPAGPAKPKRSIWTAKSFEVWRQKYCQGLPDNYVEFRFHQNENINTMRHLKPDLDVFIPVTDGLTKEDIVVFKRHYQEHCNNLLSAVISFRLEQVGWTWQVFYKGEKNSKALGAQNEKDGMADTSRPFTRAKLKKFVTNRNVQKFVNELDKQAYTSIAFLLCPHVTVVVPSEINQIIRNFLAIVEEWLSDALENYPEDFRVMKIKTLQNVMRPLEQTINTNSLYCAIQKNFRDSIKMDAFLKSLNQIDFNRLDSRIGWIAEGPACSEGKSMKEILLKPNRLPLLIRWVESIVEKSLANKVPMTEFKMHLQNTFLGLSCYFSFIKSELLLVRQDNMQLFTCTESFILEYLKYFMHMRTGMQNLIASAQASVSCNDENNSTESSEKAPKSEGKSDPCEDLFYSDDQVEHFPMDTESSDAVDKEADEILRFLTFKKSLNRDNDQRKSADHLKVPDHRASSDLMMDIDESFRKYFSSSGYVTNYFCQKIKSVTSKKQANSKEDEEEDDENEDDDEEEEEEEEEEEDDDEEEEQSSAESDNFEFGPNE